METIALKTYTSYSVLPTLQKVLKDDWKIKEVIMNYNTIDLPDSNNIETYPLTLLFETGGNELIEIKILSLTVGYPGTGPHDFQDLLDYFKIQYNPEDIFTKKMMDKNYYIKLRYKK